MKTLRQVTEMVQGSLGIGVGKAEPYNFVLYRSAFILLTVPAIKDFCEIVVNVQPYVQLCWLELKHAPSTCNAFQYKWLERL